MKRDLSDEPMTSSKWALLALYCVGIFVPSYFCLTPAKDRLVFSTPAALVASR